MSILRCTCGHTSPIPAVGLAAWRCPKCSRGWLNLSQEGTRRQNPGELSGAGRSEGKKEPPETQNSDLSLRALRPNRRITRERRREDGRSGIFGQIYEAPADLELHRRIGSTQRGDDLGRIANDNPPFRVQRRERSVRQNCPICGDSDGVTSSPLSLGLLEFVCDAKHPRTNGPYRWTGVPTS